MPWTKEAYIPATPPPQQPPAIIEPAPQQFRELQDQSPKEQELQLVENQLYSIIRGHGDFENDNNYQMLLTRWIQLKKELERTK